MTERRKNQSEEWTYFTLVILRGMGIHLQLLLKDNVKQAKSDRSNRDRSKLINVFPQNYFKRTHVPGTELFARETKTEVSGGQPHPLARSVGRTWSPMAIGLFSNPAYSMLEMNVSGIPGFLAAV